MGRDSKDIELSEEEWYDEAVKSNRDGVHCVVMVWNVKRENEGTCSGGSQGRDVCGVL